MKSFSRLHLKKIDCIPIVLSCAIMIYTLGGIGPLPPLFMYVSYVIGCVFCVFDRDLKFEVVWLVWLVVLSFGISVSNPAPVFRSWTRLGLFALLLLSTGPIIQTDRARQFRYISLKTMLIFCLFMSLGSFICYFIGVNLFVDDYFGGYINDFVGSPGHFAGLSYQSMLLGPMAGMATLFLAPYVFDQKNKLGLVLFICCLGTLLFAASRSAILATIVGLLLGIVRGAQSKSSAIKKIVVILIICLISFPLWHSATDGVVSKQTARSEQGGIFDSRTLKIQCRIKEFCEHPLFGVGFSAIDPRGADGYNSVTGTIEPGSSWFAILSMTGIIGFLFFCILFSKSIISGCNYFSEYWMLSYLAFFSVHMLAEGYVFAGGSPLAYMLWLTIGNAFDLRYKN